MAVFPEPPRSFAGSVQLIQDLLVLERIHVLPKAVVALRPDLALGDQPLEGFVDQLLSGLDVPKDLLPKHKVAAIHPNVGVLHGLNGPDGAVVVQMNGVQAARTRLNRDESSITIAARKTF